jgi:S1-C subfamily serine protease
LGIDVESPNPPLVIRAVLPGSGAADAGLRAKDVILSIGTATDPDLAAMRRIAEAALPGDDVPVTIRRGSDEIESTVRLMSFLEIGQLRAEAMRDADLNGTK